MEPRSWLQELIQLPHVRAVAGHRLPLHGPPLQIRQARRTGGLQRRGHLRADAHGDGIAHEEELQGLS